MDVDQPAIPRLRPSRVIAMPYFDVPNAHAPRLEFGYTKEQLAHCIRVIASVSHLSLSILQHTIKIPHSAAQDAGFLLDAELMCRSAPMTPSTAPRQTGTLVSRSFTITDLAGPLPKSALTLFRESFVEVVMQKALPSPTPSWLGSV